jgi:hypothetical protein
VKKGTIYLVPIHNRLATINYNAGCLAMKPNSWACIKWGQFCGDLTYVCSVQTASADKDNSDICEVVTIRLIPHLSLPTNVISTPPTISTEATSKQQCASPPERPPQMFFNRQQVGHIHHVQIPIDGRYIPNQPVEREIEEWCRFNGDTYCNGLLEMDIHPNTLNIEVVIPTVDKFTLWFECPDTRLGTAAKELAKSSAINAAEFWPHDHVEIINGWAGGRMGRVNSIIASMKCGGAQETFVNFDQEPADPAEIFADSISGEDQACCGKLSAHFRTEVD